MGKFVEFFKEQVSYWLNALGEVETILKLLLMVQRQWGSLESIFLASADIRAQLPEDTKRFETVDNEFKEQMRDVQVSSIIILPLFACISYPFIFIIGKAWSPCLL